jgi:ADP-ribose pyrophosphatase YjhB (NUDIX family)
MEDNPIRYPTVVCSCFIEKDGKFLMVYDPRFKVWRVPGGRPKFTESLEQALVREIREELNIEIEPLKFLGWGQDHQYMFSEERKTSRLLMLFYAKINKEPVIKTEEIEESKWVGFEEMKRHGNVEGGLRDFFERNPHLKL